MPVDSSSRRRRRVARRMPSPSSSMMLNSSLPNSSDKGLQFGVGEVLDGKYRVRSVEADEHGRIIHRCSRLSNGENVVILFECRNKQPYARPPHQSSPAMHCISGMQPTGRFEVRFDLDVFTCVVYAERAVKVSYRQQVDFERTQQLSMRFEQAITMESSRPPEEARRRPAPSGSRCVAYRKGDSELEVDIPPRGFDGIGTCTVSAAACFVAIAWGVAWMVVPRAFVFNLAVGMMSLLFSPCFISIASFVLWVATALAFEHENLVITPTYFKIRRKLELKPRDRDSVNNAAAAAEALTWVDTILCRQVSGRTRNLLKAEVKVAASGASANTDAGTTNSLVLLVGEKEHRLGDFLSLDERAWLAQEINEVLETTRREDSGVRSMPRMASLGRNAR